MAKNIPAQTLDIPALEPGKSLGLATRGPVLDRFFNAFEDTIPLDKFQMLMLAQETEPQLLSGTMILKGIRNIARQPSALQNMPARNQNQVVGYYPKLGLVADASPISLANPPVLIVPNAGTGSTTTVEPFICPALDPTAFSIVWVARITSLGQVAIYGYFAAPYADRGIYVYKTTNASGGKLTWAYDGTSTLLQAPENQNSKWHIGMITYSASRGRSFWANNVQKDVNAAAGAAPTRTEYQLFSTGNGGGGMNGKFLFGMTVGVDLSDPAYADFRGEIFTMASALVPLGS